MNTVDKEFEVDTKHIISATLAGQPCTTPTINVSSICINRMILTTASLSCASSILSVTGSLPISSTSMSITTTSTSPSSKSSQSALTQIIESPKRTILSCVNLEDGPILKKKIVNCEFCAKTFGWQDTYGWVTHNLWHKNEDRIEKCERDVESKC